MFHIDAAQLWQVWLASAAGRPRTVLRAKDEQHRRSLHVQRSPVFRFSDLVRAEVMPLGIQRSSLILDSRARFGCWDFGVNRRRVLRWVHDLQQGHGIWRYGIVRMDVTGLRAVQALALRRIEVRLKQHY